MQSDQKRSLKSCNSHAVLEEDSPRKFCVPAQKLPPRTQSPNKPNKGNSQSRATPTTPSLANQSIDRNMHFHSDDGGISSAGKLEEADLCTIFSGESGDRIVNASIDSPPGQRLYPRFSDYGIPEESSITSVPFEGPRGRPETTDSIQNLKWRQPDDQSGDPPKSPNIHPSPSDYPFCALSEQNGGRTMDSPSQGTKKHAASRDRMTDLVNECHNISLEDAEELIRQQAEIWEQIQRDAVERKKPTKQRSYNRQDTLRSVASEVSTKSRFSSFTGSASSSCAAATCTTTASSSSEEGENGFKSPSSVRSKRVISPNSNFGTKPSSASSSEDDFLHFLTDEAMIEEQERIMQEILSIRDQPTVERRVGWNSANGRRSPAPLPPPTKYTPEEAAQIIAQRQRPTSERVNEITESIEQVILSRQHASIFGEARVGAQSVVPGTSQTMPTRTRQRSSHHRRRPRTHHHQLRPRVDQTDLIRKLSGEDEQHALERDASVDSKDNDSSCSNSKASVSSASIAKDEARIGNMADRRTMPFSNDATVDLYGGKKLKVRGTKHTWKDIARGRATLVQCPSCHTFLQVGAKAKLLYCSQCGEISSLRIQAVQAHGQPGQSTSGANPIDGRIAQVVQQQEMDIAIAKKLAKSPIS